MRLQIETVAKGLTLMAQHLKNAPELTGERIADWMLIFGGDTSDEAFQEACLACIKSMTFFPTPGEFAAVGERNLEERTEVAWHYVKRAMWEAGRRIRASDVGGDRAALWAMAAVGRAPLECLCHAVQPEGHEARTRAAFARNYRIAARHGLGLDVWDGGAPPLPQASPALPPSQRDELEAGL
jgi:hypothetical protein